MFLLPNLVNYQKGADKLSVNLGNNPNTETSVDIQTEFTIDDLAIIASEFKKYTKYRYKLSVAATFKPKDSKIICKFWADSVYCKERNIDARIYQDNFKRQSNFLIADFEEIVSVLADDDDVINSRDKDIRKPTIKKAMRKYMPELKVLDARKARKKARKARQELARARKVAQQGAWSLD